MQLLNSFCFLVAVAVLSRQSYGQEPCNDNDLFNPNDALCYEFAEDGTVNTYDDASIYCLGKGKTLANIESQDQMSFLAQSMQHLGWSQVFVGLKYVKTGWKWVEDEMPLRGQGCQVSAYSEEAGLLSAISNSMTIETCINYCSGLGNLYAAVQQGHFCYCSTAFIWPTSASNCSLPCTGSADQRCGSMLNSVAYFTADGAYDNWRDEKPSVFGNCAAIHLDRTSNQWTDKGCSVNLPFVCKFNSEMAASVADDEAAGVQCGDSICYYLYTASTVSWVNAERFCIAKGGHLATIDKETRQDMINSLLFSSHLANDDLIWIGAVNYQWFLSSGSQLAFDGWIAPNEPVAPETYPCAATAITYDGRFGLKSTKCNDLAEGYNRFVCSSDNVVGATPAPTTPSPTHPTTKVVHTLRTSAESTTKKATTEPQLEETTPSSVETEGSTTRATLGQPIPATNEEPTTTAPSETTSKTTTTVHTTTQPTTTGVPYCNATCRNITTGNLTTMDCYETTTPVPTSTVAASNLSTTTATALSTTVSSSSSTPESAATVAAIIYSPWYETSVPCSDLQSLTPPQAVVETKLSSVISPAGFPWWGVLLIVVGGVVAIGVGIGIIVYVLMKRALGPNAVGDISNKA